MDGKVGRIGQRHFQIGSPITNYQLPPGFCCLSIAIDRIHVGGYSRRNLYRCSMELVWREREIRQVFPPTLLNVCRRRRIFWYVTSAALSLLFYVAVLSKGPVLLLRPEKIRGRRRRRQQFKNKKGGARGQPDISGL